VNSFRIAKEAYATLQEGTEQYMTSLFTKANRLAIRAKRQVIYVSDLHEAIAISKPSDDFAPQQVPQAEAASGQDIQ
jgi:histone H3/H4